MRALVLLFLLTIATRAGADCENLCDDEWWKTATIDDIKASRVNFESTGFSLA